VALTDIDPPELRSIAVQVSGGPASFTTHYEFPHTLGVSYNQHFLTPSDAFEFDLDEDELSDAEKAALIPGAAVKLLIQDAVQVAGYIDDQSVRTSAHGGTVWHIECRDWLSPAVDGHVDPNIVFNPTQTLDQLLDAVFGPFGVTVFSTDNTTNRNAITGAIYGSKTSKTGKPLKSYTLHRTKPYPNEGAFAFASRVCQRFGLWIWPSNTVGTVIVGKPDFDQSPLYQLQHSVSDTTHNNIEEGDFRISRKDQPAVIFATGFGAGGEWAKSTLRTAIANPIINTDLSSYINANPTVTFQPVPDVAAAVVPYDDPSARPLYLYDPESHTQEQLNAFVLRELSLRLRASLSAKYVIMGHRLGGHPIAVDTVVMVEDDRSNWHGPLWIIGRTFTKRPGAGGTTTHIEAIRLGSLTF
jgi:prophage tail gpP-like protein